MTTNDSMQSKLPLRNPFQLFRDRLHGNEHLFGLPRELHKIANKPETTPSKEAIEAFRECKQNGLLAELYNSETTYLFDKEPETDDLTRIEVIHQRSQIIGNNKTSESDSFVVSPARKSNQIIPEELTSRDRPEVPPRESFTFFMAKPY